MRYVSTRGQAPALGFDDVLLTGLATDGGLYVPESWPRFDPAQFDSWSGLGYPALTAKVVAPFIKGSVLEGEIDSLTAKAFSSFTHPAVAPLTQLAANDWLLELFHGPTLAFKDYPLQLVGLLFDRVLQARGSRVTIIGATSGDTGSAAIEAVRNSKAVDIFMLHPKGRVSEVQRRQMTSILSPNVHNIAVEGTFDDCQNMVKALFADTRMREAFNFSAVNSINWARIMAQVAFYVWSSLQLGGGRRALAFAVPTGNFGNVFAGYVAARMGLPVAQFAVGSNSNDILTRYFETGAMTMQGVKATLSPSMDIQISSNFERLLFEVNGRDGAVVTRLMEQLKQGGGYAVDPKAHAEIMKQFCGARLDDEGTRRVIARVRRETGELIDPHTAVGLHAARSARISPEVPRVTLATAHPAKFPDAVEAASGLRPGLPPGLADLMSRPERLTALPNDLDAVKDFIREKAAR